MLFAQNETNTKALNLSEVSIKGIRPEHFMIGQKIQEIDSANLVRNRFSTLADFLQFQSPVSFKSYGAGQVTSISFRGTSANHTALLWNGININFPSLGQTDFSTIPLSGFDEMTIQYGSAASCVGTDAIGGSILLRSAPVFKTKGWQFSTANRAESSDNFSTQFGLKFNKNLKNEGKFSGKTLVYGSSFKNNFGTEPISNKKGKIYPLEPIHTLQKGIVQDLYLLSKKGDLLSLNFWLSDNNLTIQPTKPILREITRTQAYRTVLAYQLGKTLFRSAFIRDITDYGKGENPNPSHTQIDRYLLRIEHDFSWIKSCDKATNLKIGSEIVHFEAQVDGYGVNKKTENRADFYALLRHQFSARLITSLNLRQALISSFNPPFTPSLGIEYMLLKNEKSKITLPASVSRGYRVPTLNERYWVNLGNPDLKPETSFNKEIGVSWQQKCFETTQIKLITTFFHNLIDNWTYWNPDKGYRVENLQQVLSKGIEIEANYLKTFRLASLSSSLHYGLTNASQQKEYGPYTQEILGKQLIYVPRHAISNTTTFTKNTFSVSVQQQFNSKRHITFDHSGTPFLAYYLMNIQTNYVLNLNKLKMNTSLQINNVTNTLYPNLKKNAMPMRSVAISVVVWSF